MKESLNLRGKNLHLNSTHTETEMTETETTETVEKKMRKVFRQEGEEEEVTSMEVEGETGGLAEAEEGMISSLEEEVDEEGEEDMMVMISQEVAVVDEEDLMIEAEEEEETEE